MKNLGVFIILIIAVIIESVVLRYVKKHSHESNRQLIKAFMSTIICMIGWSLALIIQLFVVNFISEDKARYVDYFLVYPFIIFMPLALFFFAYIFKNKKITFQRWFILLFIIPVVTMFVVFTNELHHLFYEVYSTDISVAKFGPFYTYVYQIYSYGFLAIDLLILLRSSIKSTALFSVQTLLVFTSILIPFVVSIVGSIGLLSISIYTTPISFSASIVILRNCAI